MTALTIAERREKVAEIVARAQRLRATLPVGSPLLADVWKLEALCGEIEAAFHAAQLREERGES